MLTFRSKEDNRNTSHKELGTILVNHGIITEKQLEEAQERQAHVGGFLGKILCDSGVIKKDTLISFMVKECKIPHLSLLDYEISKDVLSIIPEDICEKYNLLPIDKLGRILTVAMVDPFDEEALNKVRTLCPDLRIKPILCNWDHYKTVSDRIFGPNRESKEKSNENIDTLIRVIKDAHELPCQTRICGTCCWVIKTGNTESFTGKCRREKPWEELDQRDPACPYFVMSNRKEMGEK